MANRTKEERDILAALGFSLMLTWIDSGSGIDYIKRVFLKSSITPQDIVSAAKKKLHLIADSGRVIYEHIQYAIYHEMRDDPNSSTVDAMYEVAQDYFKSLGNTNEYAKLVRSVNSGKDFTFQFGPGRYACMLYFLIYEQITLPEQLLKKIRSHIGKYVKERVQEKPGEKCLSLNKLFFSDGQNVGTSNAYGRLRESAIDSWIIFLKRKYQSDEICVDNWHEIVTRNIHIGIYRNSYGEMHMDEGGCIETATMESISILGHEKFHFGYDTLVMVMGDLHSGHSYLKNHHPDVVELFEIALQALIGAYFACNKLQCERIHFRKTLPAYVAENCDTLYNNLVNLYYIDCLYKVLENNRDEYYYNFAWFYDIEKAEEIKPDVSVVPTEATKEDSSTGLFAELNAQYERERTRILEVGKKFAHDLAEKDRIIEAHIDEITELRHQLQIQQEYINLTNTPEEPSAADTIDISPLYGKRFLFVGQILESYSELRKAFPDSVFMENETTSIKSLKIDGVVLLIRNMSHSMYYKVMQNSQLTELPRVYCNSRNINNVYQAMLRSLNEL